MKYFVLLFFIIGCKPKSTPSTSLSKFDKDTKLMLEISQKLSHENDPEKLHEIALSIQRGRIAQCTSITKECALYGKLISFFIEASQDKKISIKEKNKFREKIRSLQIEIFKARKILEGR